MALTLEQYAAYLDTRDLPWPAPPEVKKPKARPHLSHLPKIRAVLWNVYGTLLAIPGGSLYFEHPQRLLMNVALDKTVQEFKMWGSMTRRPGQPGEYLAQLYAQSLLEQKGLSTGGGERHPETAADRVWEGIIKKLLQKDYKFDAGFFGSLNEFSRKVAYFFHASLQGTACYVGAADALLAVKEKGLAQGLLAEGQCFTETQLQRGLASQDGPADLDQVFDEDLRVLSFEVRARKPSEKIFRHALKTLSARGIEPEHVLHIGSRLPLDIVPAKKLGMRTALFAGDKASLEASPEQLKEPASRPDVLLTDLEQLAEVI